MTKEEIIKLARKAGFADGLAEFIGLSTFQRFADLVAAEKDKKIQELEDIILELQERM